MQQELKDAIDQAYAADAVLEYAELILVKFAGWITNPVTGESFVQVFKGHHDTGAGAKFGCDLMLEY